MIEIIEQVNNAINGVVWGTAGIALLLVAGLVMTAVNRGFQFTHLAHWISKTIGAIFTDKHITAHTARENKAISQFQSLCTAMAATIGTGNIVGVATAIILGGPGAIFWMWIMALVGMMTNYSENVLGIYFRQKSASGEWRGGAMYYLKEGLGGYKGLKTVGTVLAVLFSVFCLLASFGIGNMSQVNSIASNMQSAFNVPSWVTGVALMVIAALVVLGGLKRVATVTEKLVPFMAVLYIAGALIVVFMHASAVPAVFASIFRGAFATSAAGGGIVGYGVKSAITWGFKRGAFSNEAGLGSSVMVHSSSNVKEPVQQGMWGIFEVFADTIVVCTLTALVVLTSGSVDLETGRMLTENAGAGLVGEAFGTVFGHYGQKFIAIAILLFAFSTSLGWSHYGSTAWQYLFGEKSIILYKAVFVAMIFFGCTMRLSLAWDLSDTFNGLMMIPNLIGVLSLSPLVARITANYVKRVIRGESEEALLSAYTKVEERQKEVV
ncbi:MAG: alanine:cation symporter family protein [Spirochaetaceae bacterium]|nr:alanine:cation symporter family protein [Spirochaetaceae bacterium]